MGSIKLTCVFCTTVIELLIFALLSPALNNYNRPTCTWRCS